MKGWRRQLHIIIFGTDTFWGKFFDLALLISISLSVLVVMLESVEDINRKYGEILRIIEWVFTVLFTLEYIARIIVTDKPRSYVLSFLGIIDLLAILPAYLGLIFSGTHALMVIRSIRLIRIFRILKFARYISAGGVITSALRASAAKITVFLVAVLSMTIILGTAMYIFEGSENGFSNIPKSIYWAIVTLTTVGYGDITPQTFMGQVVASIIMILGYGIIAVPTGIVSGEFIKAKQVTEDSDKEITCPSCDKKDHDEDASYCKHCGQKIR